MLRNSKDYLQQSDQLMSPKHCCLAVLTISAAVDSWSATMALRKSGALQISLILTVKACDTAKLRSRIKQMWNIQLRTITQLKFKLKTHKLMHS